MEINDWLADAAHKEEFLLLHINDEGVKLDWGHIELVQQPVQAIFGKVIFTPLEKEKNFPSRWCVCMQMQYTLIIVVSYLGSSEPTMKLLPSSVIDEGLLMKATGGSILCHQ